MHDGNLWHAVTQMWAGPGVETYLDVRMKDGTSFVGRWVGHTNEPDPTKRELTLSDISVRQAGQNDLVTLGRGWKFVVLHGSDIAYISTYYFREKPTRAQQKSLISKLGSSIRQNWTSWRFAVFAIAVLLVVALLIGSAQQDMVFRSVLVRGA